MSPYAQIPDGWSPLTIAHMTKGTVEDRARSVFLALTVSPNWCLIDTKRGQALCDIEARHVILIPTEVIQFLIDLDVIECQPLTQTESN